MRTGVTARAWGLLAYGLIACTPATVRTGLDEADADRILVALDAAAIGAAKVRERTGAGSSYRIEVASADVAHARRVAAETVAERPQPGLAEWVARPGLIPSLEAERARWSAAVAGELARSLRTVDGVHDARVHLALAAAAGDALDARPGIPRASVLVTLRDHAPRLDERTVRALVCGAVQGLEPEHVAVIQAPARSTAVRHPRVVRLGPIAILAESLPALRAIGGALFAALGGLAIGLVALWRHRRR